jgi:hypothetical protein
MKFTALPRRATLVAALTLAAASAHAGLGSGGGSVLCDDSINTIANDAYAGSCQGPVLGSITPASVATFDGIGYVFAGASNDGSGVFAANPGVVDWGTLTLSATPAGPFVIGLQGSDSYSLYLFSGGIPGAGSIDFDRFGLATALGQVAPDVQHAALFALAPVPEPASYGLMAAGLGLVGFMRRRQRQGQRQGQRA